MLSTFNCQVICWIFEEEICVRFEP